MRDHIDIVGILFMAYGGLQLFGAVSIGLLMAGLGGFLGFLGASEGQGDLMVMGGFYGVFGVAIAVFMAVFGVPYILVGGGLRRRAQWARLGGMVMGGLALMNMPLGTLLGVYAFVTLLDKDVTEEFS